MLAPVVNASVVAAIKAKAEVVDLQLKPAVAYELTVTADAWIRQRRENEDGDAAIVDETKNEGGGNNGSSFFKRS